MRLLAVFLVLAFSCCVSARLAAVATDDFEVQGLELLQQRYGSAYPGYGATLGGTQQWGTTGAWNQQLGSVGQFGLNPSLAGTKGQQGLGMGVGAIGAVSPFQQQQQFGIGAIPPMSTIGNVGVGVGAIGQQQFPVGAIGQQQFGINPIEQQYSGVGQVGMQTGFPLGMTGMEQFGTVGSAANVAGLAMGAIGQEQMIKMNELNQMASSGLFGAGAIAAVQQSSGGSKKGQTTVAQPIYAESMVVPKIITQPILRPHYVQQPIVQQQLVQQPIVETRRVVQPIVRRIITQPIIRPQVIESTTIQPTLKTETIVQPHLIQQTVVQPTVQNVMEEAQPIQEKPKTQVQQPVVQPVQKKSGGGLSGVY